MKPARLLIASLARIAARFGAGVICCAAGVAAVHAQPADLLITHARIVTLDSTSRIAQAMAVRDGRIIAVGRADEVAKTAGRQTRIVDAGGRTVIPGLIDSHIHAIRAALTYSTEVNWIDAATIPEAMARLHDAAARMRPGAWLVVAGGWTEQQFAERRRPTMAEVVAAAPDNPVYIQLFYASVLLTPKAMDALAMAPDQPPPGIRIERDAGGAPTGWWSGGITAITPIFDRLPKADFEDNLAGSRQFFRELNRLAVTGVVDPGGFNIAAPQYAALQKLWREKELTVRVAFALFAQNPGGELAEFKDLTQFLPMGFGDDMLHFNGLGERITIAMYNNNDPDPATRAKFMEIIRWAARQGMAVTIHWQENGSVGKLLDMYEEVDRETPIAGLRWSIAHLDDGTPETFARMKALGIGWTMQDAMYFSGDAMIETRGDAVRHMPPIMTALRQGVHVGAGTDAHRVASYNPFVALQWMLDTKTVSGRTMREADEIPSREMALRLYTLGSAWFSFDEDRRGSLEAGKLADFAILDQDYMSIPVDRIHGIASVMTVVGGRVVYAAAPFQGVASQQVLRGH